MKNIIFGLFLLIFSACSCSTVEPGNVGVAITWGHLENWTYKEGFHMRSAWTDVHMMTTQTQTYTMAGQGQEGEATGSINVLTRDQLAVLMDVTVQFHLNPNSAIPVYRYFGEGYADNIIHPLVRTAIRDAASEFGAIQMIDERAVLQNRMEQLVRENLRSTLHTRNIPQDALEIDNILVRNIDLPQSLEESIANVQRQHQETQQRLQALETARAEADRLRVQAEGEATARLVRARAEAESNRIISESLTSNILRAREIDLTGQLLSNQSSRVIMVPNGMTPLMQMPNE